MSADGDCPVCPKRGSHPIPRTALDYVRCPMCEDGACRYTKADCDGRILHSFRRGDGELLEDIGFPCQEPVTRSLRLGRRGPS